MCTHTNNNRETDTHAHTHLVDVFFEEEAEVELGLLLGAGDDGYEGVVGRAVVLHSQRIMALVSTQVFTLGPMTGSKQQQQQQRNNNN